MNLFAIISQHEIIKELAEHATDEAAVKWHERNADVGDMLVLIDSFESGDAECGQRVLVDDEGCATINWNE